MVAVLNSLKYDMCHTSSAYPTQDQTLLHGAYQWWCSIHKWPWTNSSWDPRVPQVNERPAWWGPWKCCKEYFPCAGKVGQKLWCSPHQEAPKCQYQGQGQGRGGKEKGQTESAMLRSLHYLWGPSQRQLCPQGQARKEAGQQVLHKSSEGIHGARPHLQDWSHWHATCVLLWWVLWWGNGTPIQRSQWKNAWPTSPSNPSKSPNNMSHVASVQVPKSPSQLSTKSELSTTSSVQVVGVQEGPKFQFLPLDDDQHMQLCKHVQMKNKVCNIQQDNVIQFLEGPPLHTKQITGDGNCLFCALAIAITGHQTGHRKVQQDIYRYIEEHSPYNGELGPLYLQQTRMKKNKIYVTDMSCMLQCNLLGGTCTSATGMGSTK